MLRRGCFAILLLFCSGDSFAGIVLDFSHDTSTDNFFGMSSSDSIAAKAAVQQAAADISAVLFGPSTLTPVTMDSVSGTSNSAMVTGNVDWSYTNPSTGATENIPDVSTVNLANNEIKIFVGMQELSGMTLGQGGPGSIGISTSVSYSNSSDIPGAITAFEMAANAEYGRGNAMIIGTTSGTLGGNPIAVNHGVTIGTLWFDIDTDNDGVSDLAPSDTNADPSDTWHFDHTTSVASGKIDLYSVALHEILHAVGAGTSDSWDALASTDTWAGTEANGTMLDLDDNGTTYSHIASGTMSTVFNGAGTQEAVLTPSISAGERRFLTNLDVAMIRDIGLVAVPEASSFAMLGLIAFCFGTKSVWNVYLSLIHI